MNFYQLYHSDSYLREMEAVVVHVEGNRIALDQTGFYAQSGGQPADHGTLSCTGAQTRVIDVRRRVRPAFMACSMDPPVCLNALYTALHILCGVIWRDYEAHVTSSSMEPGKARQGFELERLTLDFVTEVERRVNAEIEANREVRIRFLSRAEAFTHPHQGQPAAGGDRGGARMRDRRPGPASGWQHARRTNWRGRLDSCQRT
jgi:misacylated tRNA(Ala) deacylase